jgi:hypothetical protein
MNKIFIVYAESILVDNPKYPSNPVKATKLKQVRDTILSIFKDFISNQSL